MSVCQTQTKLRSQRNVTRLNHFYLLIFLLWGSEDIKTVSGADKSKILSQPGRVMSIFHISHTNGGIGDPVVDLQHNMREGGRITWEGNERNCLL